MFEERYVMDELDKFFEDDEKSKKRYKLLVSFDPSASYKGKFIKLGEAKKKEVKKRVVKVHKKGSKENDNIF
jgi:hypothetical protein